ncbi:DUF3618 domain-containing protein [Leucobacter luti]|uniref:Uncharacterized protein DUF3618 n=1 Tax=Leucobacter luti TaxID=340320 RepID=A0A4R6RQQ3_9MICO|nr:DUF3618 domain-containing protein [Leucobacter luti]MCW2289478.1 type VI protein secretion system component VasF [Leucobacter luti]QYM74760.1 DUF3618 domain-containing protein [Leucobacter luti]TCK33911.1 uncharacterized protein DUF3618 [Leucobacter luti]TDP89123.1 uncharacterized protein DUF3618 [Leucobacter luti]
MSAKDREQGVAEAQHARAELYDTLSQLQNRLNYAQRIDDSVADAKRRIAEEKEQNPLRFIAGVAGVAAVAGLVVWGIARSVAKRFP